LHKCKYCGENIGIVVPEPLTCWKCYKKLRDESNISIDPRNDKIIYKAEDLATKKCEMCGRTLHLSNFSKTGNSLHKYCKECVIKDYSQKFLGTLRITQIRKIAQSGIKSTNLSDVCDKQHSTCMQYFNNLVKAGYGYKREINGVNTFFIKKDVAKKFIEHKEIDDISKIVANVNKTKNSREIKKNTSFGNIKLTAEYVATKKCEMCGKTLPISHFHRTGNSHKEKCKDCVVKDSARRCLEHLTTSDIKKMVISGITATYLSNKLNRSRSTCQALLSDLSKTNYAYKKEINGLHTFFIPKNMVEDIIKMKRQDKVKLGKVSPKKSIKSHKPENIETKKCVVCKKILPIDDFYKMGNSRNKMCKSCVRSDMSKRCLESLSSQQITKMSNTGVTAEYLAKQWDKTRSTCQSMLASLVKTGDAYRKVIKGKSTYFMDKKKAENLLKQKIPQKNQYSSNKKIYEKPLSQIQSSHSATVPIISDVNSEGMILEKMPNQGLLIKNLDIHHLGSIIQEIRKIDPDFNFEILTKGNKSQIFLSEDLLLRFAYKNIGNVLKNYE